MKSLLIVCISLTITTIISFSGMVYFEAMAFDNARAYDEALNALEAYQRTRRGNVDMAYVCKRK